MKSVCLAAITIMSVAFTAPSDKCGLENGAEKGSCCPEACCGKGVEADGETYAIICSGDAKENPDAELFEQYECIEEKDEEGAKALVGTTATIFAIVATMLL